MREFKLLLITITTVIGFSIFLSCAGTGTQAHVKRLNELGITCLRNKMFQDAVFWFDKIIELEDQNEAALNNIGIAYEGLGQLETAMKYYQRAYEISNDPRILQNIDSLKKITGDEQENDE